jgi:hypothetical protein
MNKIKQEHKALRASVISIRLANLFGAILELRVEKNSNKHKEVSLKICTKNLRAFFLWEINQKTREKHKQKLNPLERQKERIFT